MIQPTLAQAGTGSGLQLLIWSGVVIGVLVFAFAGLMLIRRKLTAAQASSEPPVGGLEHLRRLRELGRISEDEFQEARARLIKRVSAKMNTPKPSGEPAPRMIPGAAATRLAMPGGSPASLAPKPSTPSARPNTGYPNAPSTDGPALPTE